MIYIAFVFFLKLVASEFCTLLMRSGRKERRWNMEHNGIEMETLPGQSFQPFTVLAMACHFIYIIIDLVCIY